MAKADSESNAGLIVFLAVFGTALPVLGFAGWDQALRFDPCANIFMKAGKCIGSGASLSGGGLFLIALGLVLAGSAGKNALKSGKASLGVLAVGWLGVWMAVIGGAMAYAGLSML
ncbi:MAG: hypothetical protein R3E14_10615 [Erythrobacter sp.]